MVEENFGYSLPHLELTPGDVAHTLREEIKSSKRYVLFSFLEALAIPYLAEKISGKLSDPWESITYSGLLLGEILAVGACLYSAYTWKKAASHLSELEKKVFQEE